MKKISIVFSLVILLLFSLTSSCFASTYPDISSVIDTEYYDYVIYTLSSGDITARVVKSNDKSVLDNISFVYKDTSTAAAGKFYIGNSGVATIYCYQYLLQDGEWVSISNTAIYSKSGENFEDISNATIFESTKNIYYSSDMTGSEIPPFFQKTLPLLETTLKMVAVETPTMGTEVLKIMKIILLCGVGCLALLISLPLFSKALRRWVQ